MGLDIDIRAIAKDKVPNVVKEDCPDYNADGKEDEITFIPRGVMRANKPSEIFYSRKNEFLKKELQNAIRGRITEGEDYLGHISDVVMDAAAITRLENRITQFEQDIPGTIALIQEMHELSSFHAAVVAFSELVVCVSEITRQVNRDKDYVVFSWLS